MRRYESRLTFAVSVLLALTKSNNCDISALKRLIDNNVDQSEFDFIQISINEVDVDIKDFPLNTRFLFSEFDSSNTTDDDKVLVIWKREENFPVNFIQRKLLIGQNREIWILLDQEIDWNVFDAFHVPMSRKLFLFSLGNVHEVYHVLDTLHKNLIGQYDAFDWRIAWKSPRNVSESELLLRRKDLGGNLNLTFLVETSRPYCIVTSDFGVQPAEARGPYVDLVNFLAASLNFTAVLVRSRDGKWTTMVEDLALGLFDGSATDFSITDQRAKHIDFCIPLDWTSYNMVIKRPGQSLSWLTYFLPFNTNFWVVILVTALLGSLAIYALNKHLKDENVLALDALATTARSLVGLDVPGRMPQRASARILLFGVLITGILIWNSYQASLTSWLTVMTWTLPVRSLDEAVKSGFTVSVWGGTAIEAALQMSPADSEARRAYEAYLLRDPNANRHSNEVGLRMASTESDFAFLTVTPEIEDSEHFPCSIVIIPDIAFEFPIGLAFRPGFELLPLFNAFIRKALETGQLGQWESRAAPRPKTCPPPDIGVRFENIIFAFAALLVGIASGIILALCERLSRKNRV